MIIKVCFVCECLFEGNECYVSVGKRMDKAVL